MIKRCISSWCAWMGRLFATETAPIQPGQSSQPVERPKRTNPPVEPTLVWYLPAGVLDLPADNARPIEEFARLKGWKELAERYGGAAKFAPRRAFQGDLAALRRLESYARANAERLGIRGYRPVDLERYFLLSIPDAAQSPSLERYCDLKTGLQKLGGAVYLSMPTRPASASDAYLGPAQVAPQMGDQSVLGGIGALGLLSRGPLGSTVPAPLTGTGQVVIDVEFAWHQLMSHCKALPGPAGASDWESNDPSEIQHGTAVAAIVVGGGVTAQMSGIAPNASFFKAPVFVNVGTPGEPILEPSLLSAIVNAGLELERLKLEGSLLGPGVLLIEQQTGDRRPIECSPAEFAAIQLVAGNNNVVVLPAGNGARDLDLVMGLYTDPVTGALLERSLDPDAGGPTSGAIVVAAACSGRGMEEGVGGELFPTSNYGKIIDCWAWGDSIATLGLGLDEQGNVALRPHPDGFGETSGAAAIVAGAVLLMLQMRTAAGQKALTLPQVRELLRDTTLNTVGAPPLLTSKCMPNLAGMQDKIENGWPEPT